MRGAQGWRLLDLRRAAHLGGKRGVFRVGGLSAGIPAVLALLCGSAPAARLSNRLTRVPRPPAHLPSAVRLFKLLGSFRDPSPCLHQST